MIRFHERPSAGAAAALAAQLQATLPVIETERLTLRAPRIEDFDAFAAMLEAPRGEHYGNPKTREDTWAIFMQLTGTWLLRGHGVWTVVKRDTGVVQGFAQIGAEPGDQEHELGYLVSVDAEGQGIAFEAAAAIRDHAFRDLSLASLVSYVDPENTRSARLAERLGGKRDAEAEDALPLDDKCCVYRHSKPEDV